MKYQFIRRAAAMALALVLAMSLAAPVYAEDEAPLSIKCDREAPLKINETAALTLTAEWAAGTKPEGEIKYEWTYDDNSGVVGFAAEKAASGEDEGAQKKITVTGKKTGEAKITLTATPADGKPITAEYKLEVMEISLDIIGYNLWTNKTEDEDKSFLVRLNGIIDDNPEITWSAKPSSAQAGVVAPTFSGTGAVDHEDEETGEITSTTVTGTTVTVNEQTAGIFDITAEYTYNGTTYSKSTQLIISGIILSGTALDAKKKTLEIAENGSAVLSAIMCSSTGYSNVHVEWTSSDPLVVSVMPDAGNLYAGYEGTADIIVTDSKGEYSARCTVTVVKDTSAVADEGYTASVSNPLTLDVVYPRLEEICEEKTKAMNGGDALELLYITNLSVPTSQGTLYYNYNTEADTGSGVGANHQFAWTASGSIRDVHKLYFVPKPGFSGTAEISFTAIAKGSRNFAGVIKVYVGMNPDDGNGGEYRYQISYRAQAGEPVWFSASDFNAYCQSVNGRNYNYIIFNLPKSSDGVLYYNYTTAGSGNPVSADTRFSQSGRYTVNDVCFVPNIALENNSSIIIKFRAVDTSGTAINGEVEVNVTQPNSGNNSANVIVSGERGRPVPLLGELFEAACRNTIDDNLSFVTFKLPDPNEGILYCNYESDGNYESRVTAGTHYHYSGMPGLSSISFVPASGTAGQVAISYTGYGVGGASYNGTLYIILEEVDRSAIYYSVAKGGSVTFSAADFYYAGLYQKGVAVNYVIFTDLSGYSYFNFGSLGRLYYNYRGSSYYNGPVYPGSSYYYSPRYSWQNRLGLISFHAGDKAGTITIPYSAYDSSNKWLFDSKVVIQVGALAPDDVRLSCRTSEQAQLSASAVYAACSAVMNESLSYIEITSVPDAQEGHLYYNYSGFGTGTVVKPGDRFYSVGSPSIGRLIFVPRAGFSGEAVITYIGCSFNGQERVSGQILVNVAASTASRYFADMSEKYSWAFDSVDYLYRNRAVVGIGDDRFNPSGIVTRGEFTQMLVKAYGLTATGSVSFDDVPANKYYTDAIRVAVLLGIASGSGGKFNPEEPITRQDAMVMIYNTLKISGKTTTNGLTTDFSVYRDEREIDPNAKEAMGSLIQMGVVTGDGYGRLRPLGQLNRAEAAVLLHTIMTL